MDTRFSVILETNFSCDITSIYEDLKTKDRKFKIKIYNKQNFFLFECTESSLSKIIPEKTFNAKKGIKTIEKLHEMLSDYFNKSSNIDYYFIKKIVTLNYEGEEGEGDFTEKTTDSFKKPVSGVDKLLIKVIHKYQSVTHLVWLIFREQFSLGPSTEEILKEVKYLKTIVKVTAEDNARLNRKKQDLEGNVKSLNKKNDNQDENFDKGMRNVDKQNKDLRKVIMNNKKENGNLQVKLNNTKKELELCRVDVSILLSNVGRLKDRISFLLQVLKKKKQEVVKENVKQKLSQRNMKERLTKKLKNEQSRFESDKKRLESEKIRVEKESIEREKKKLLEKRMSQPSPKRERHEKPSRGSFRALEKMPMKFSRKRKHIDAVIDETGYKCSKKKGADKNIVYISASVNKVLTKGKKKWSFKYIFTGKKKKNVNGVFVGIYDPTKLVLTTAPNEHIGSESMLTSKAINFYKAKVCENGKYHSKKVTKLKSGDIVSCTIDLNQGTFSIKVNGKNYGVVMENLKGPISPVVSIGNEDESFIIVE